MAAHTTFHRGLQQEVIEERLDNGLTVVVLPKPGFQQKFASFATHYGGMDGEFKPPGETASVKVPDGIAHFLEHKLFDQPDGTNVLQEFTRLGASPNAFTTPMVTAYHFSTVDSFDESLALLLDYVLTPYFTAESVAKEQGIIGQEIQMGLDDPDRMVMYNLFESLFQKHPARIRVIGSVDSIAQITPELLYRCHETFYHPSNMMLVVAGDVDAAEVIRFADQKLQSRGFADRPPIERIIPDEPDGVLQPEVRHRLRISRHNLAIGIKGSLEPAEDDASRTAHHRRLIAADLALGTLFGRDSELYWQLYEDGTITEHFHFGYHSYPGTGAIVVGGETEHPDRFSEAILSALERARDEGLSAEIFELRKRREIGNFLRTVDRPASLVHQFTMYRFHGLDFFASRNLYEEVGVEEANEVLRLLVDRDQCVLSVVEPTEGDV